MINRELAKGPAGERGIECRTSAKAHTAENKAAKQKRKAVCFQAKYQHCAAGHSGNVHQ